jgi:drug/metabolite transporter (DMT)-like permease
MASRDDSTTRLQPLSWFTLLCLAVAMWAFAANSILCRLALAGRHIDPLSFTSIRLVSGAVTLTLILVARNRRPVITIDPLATVALIVYAVAFSISYVGLAAGVGALLLFGAVQVTMLSVGFMRGERLAGSARYGFVIAVAGLVAYLLPGNDVPPLMPVAAMLLAGGAWGIYSLRGAHGQDPIAATTSNFLAAAPITVMLAYLFSDGWHLSSQGIVLAALSGSLTSGLGYVLWYFVVRRIPSLTAATVQLGVPIFAALGGVVWLGEQLGARLVAASVAVIGGIALVVFSRHATAAPRPGAASDRAGHEQWVHGGGI